MPKSESRLRNQRNIVSAAPERSQSINIRNPYATYKRTPASRNQSAKPTAMSY